MNAQTATSPSAIATRVRSSIVGAGSPRGMCAVATEALVDALLAAGLPARHAFGYFRVDPEDWYEHHFALLNGNAIDVTADQFNDMIQEGYPPVYVGPVLPEGSKGIGHHWFDEGPIFLR